MKGIILKDFIPVTEWYYEIGKYNWFKPSLSSATERFTQVIWNSERRLDVDRAVSKTNIVYVVANYLPAGNMIHAFPANVRSCQAIG